MYRYVPPHALHRKQSSNVIIASRYYKIVNLSTVTHLIIGSWNYNYEKNRIY